MSSSLASSVPSSVPSSNPTVLPTSAVYTTISYNVSQMVKNMSDYNKSSDDEIFQIAAAAAVGFESHISVITIDYVDKGTYKGTHDLLRLPDVSDGSDYTFKYTVCFTLGKYNDYSSADDAYVQSTMMLVGYIEDGNFTAKLNELSTTGGSFESASTTNATIGDVVVNTVVPVEPEPEEEEEEEEEEEPEFFFFTTTGIVVIALGGTFFVSIVLMFLYYYHKRLRSAKFQNDIDSEFEWKSRDVSNLSENLLPKSSPVPPAKRDSFVRPQIKRNSQADRLSTTNKKSSVVSPVKYLN